jgi:hypothetical protein
MLAQIPCTRHDRTGTADPLPGSVLAQASKHAERDIAPLLRSLYAYDGELVATWRDFASREAGLPALSAAWQACMGDTRMLHLVPHDEDYDYQEDVVDNGTDC